MASRGKATVVWELSEEGRVVVDVDAPLRPFGVVPTPARGLTVPSTSPTNRDGTEPDGEPVDDLAVPPKAPKPTR